MTTLVLSFSIAPLPPRNDDRVERLGLPEALRSLAVKTESVGRIGSTLQVEKRLIHCEIFYKRNFHGCKCHSIQLFCDTAPELEAGPPVAGLARRLGPD